MKLLSLTQLDDTKSCSQLEDMLKPSVHVQLEKIEFFWGPFL